MNTQIFKNYDDFFERQEKIINGVSPEFAEKFPNYAEMNQTNTGCWDCYNCTECYGCRNCIECQDCIRCNDLVLCTDCNRSQYNYNTNNEKQPLTY